MSFVLLFPCIYVIPECYYFFVLMFYMWKSHFDCIAPVEDLRSIKIGIILTSMGACRLIKFIDDKQ